MTRRTFALISFIPFLTGCIGQNPKPKSKNKINIPTEIKKIISARKKTIFKINNLDIPMNKARIGIIHSIAWCYGPFLSLSEEDINIKVFNGSNTLCYGLGLKDRLPFLIKNNTKNININKIAQKEGFIGYMDMFLTIYERLLNLNTLELIYMKEDLESLNLDKKYISMYDFEDWFFAPYNREKTYIVVNGLNIYIEDNDIYLYVTSINIMLNLLNSKNFKRGKINGL